MTPLEINKKIAAIKSMQGADGVSVSIGDNGQPTNRVAYLCKIDDNVYVHSQFYNWAESIGDAWELFEEMPGGVITKFDDTEDGNDIYFCTNDVMNYSEWAFEASSAICLAWLKWKEI